MAKSDKPRTQPPPVAATVANAMKGLLAQLAIAVHATRADESERAKGLRVLLTDFQRQLDDILLEKPKRLTPPTSAVAEGRSTARPRAAERSSSAGARRRVYRLERVRGEVAKVLVVHEQVDDALAPEDREYAVGCLELLSDEPWSWIVADLEGDAIRLEFPDDKYSGMPPYLDLEKPRKPQLGQTWRMLRTDRSVAATYTLRSIDVMTGRVQNPWHFGDIVRAWDGSKLLVARYIREVRRGKKALVHWLTDDNFGEIPFENIRQLATVTWTRDLHSEDVEIEF